MGKSKLVILTALIGLAACTGSQGPQGAQGATGAPGASDGTIAGTVTSSDAASGATAPAPNIAVTLTPVVGVSSTTLANGSYTLANVPVGTYTVTFAGPSISTTTVSNVVVVAGTTTTLNEVVAYSPITVSLAAPAPAGFSSKASVTAAVAGATGPLTYKWSLTAPGGLSSTAVVPVLSASGTSATFTTNAFSDYNFQTVPSSVSGTGNGGVQLAGTSLIIPNRATLLGITPGQEASGFNYTVNLTVSDGTYTQTGSTSVYPIGSSPGTPYNAANVTLIANDVAATGNSWTLAFSATDPTVQSGTSNETSLIQNPTSKNPIFTTNAAGFWALTNSATTTTLYFRTADYVGVGAQPSTYASCGACHPAGSPPGSSSPPAGETDTLSPDVAWGKWIQSAHGNYYWDPTGQWYAATGSPPSAIPTTTVTINGAAGFPTVGTVTIPTVTGAFTLFSQGVDGVIGSHYGVSCIMCHTDGYKNPEALNNLNNGGFSDVAAQDGWTFPNDSTINYTRYATAVPANLQNLAGIQCESCHGPISLHPGSVPSATKPKPVWNATACGVCHDDPPTHATYLLWSQSKHANYQVAINEGGSSSCARCHTAQGFANYVDNGLGTYLPPATIATGTAEGAMPQTCQSCHDPHTTGLRINPVNAYVTPAGFTVEQVGKGSTCFACHNTRNFARGDDVPACALGISSGSSSGASPLCTPATTVLTASGVVTVPNIATPHDGRQGDLMMGTNAYFVTTGVPSKHMAVSDTCVGCHVQLHPTSVSLSGSNTNHTFKADGTICVNCHASTLSGTPSLSQLEGQWTLAQANMFSALPGYLNQALAANSATSFFVALSSYYTPVATSYTTLPSSTAIPGCTSSAPCVVSVTSSQISSIWINGSSLVFTLSTPLSVGTAPTSVSQFSVSLANLSLSQTSSTVIGPQLFEPNGVLARVIWNNSEVSSITSACTGTVCTKNPAALVIHNPTFVFNVLAASQAALENPPVQNGGACTTTNCALPY